MKMPLDFKVAMIVGVLTPGLACLGSGIALLMLMHETAGGVCLGFGILFLFMGGDVISKLEDK